MKWRLYSKELPIVEWFFYHIINILTFFSAWAVKTVIKKAIAEAYQDIQRINEQQIKKNYDLLEKAQKEIYMHNSQSKPKKNDVQQAETEA